MTDVTAAIVLYNAEKLIPDLAETLTSLPRGLKKVVYDSASSDNSVKLVSETIEGAQVIQGPNQGFGYGNNRCLERIDSKYTLFLNSDASISAESLGKLVKFLNENPDYAGVQPLVRLWGWNSVTASCGVFLTEYGEAWDSRFMHLEHFPLRTPLQVPAVTAAVSLFRTEALMGVKGFDQRFFMYFEDADLSLRLGTAGWKLAVVREAEAFHMTGASSTRRSALAWELESSVRMYRRYLGNGRLSGKWLKRELKIQLHDLAAGRHTLWRTRAILKALKGSADPVKLPDQIQAFMFGEPVNLPQQRLQKNSPGPGFTGKTVSPWGGLSTQNGSLDIVLKAQNHAVTGAVSGGDGSLLQRFCIAAGYKEKVRLADAPPVVYIHCDSSSDRLEVTIL